MTIGMRRKDGTVQEIELRRQRCSGAELKSLFLSSVPIRDRLDGNCSRCNPPSQSGDSTTHPSRHTPAINDPIKHATMFWSRAPRGGRGGDRTRSSASAGGRVRADGRGRRMSYAEWGKSVRSLACFRPPLLHVWGMRRRFVPGHFFRLADNKPSRLPPSLCSVPCPAPSFP